MTFDEWWEDFVAEHDEWKYADSAALRRAAFQAGAASRDAEFAAERKVANQAEADAFKYGQEIVKLRTQINVLQMALADTEALELGTAEKCDQLRAELVKALAACKVKDAAITEGLETYKIPMTARIVEALAIQPDDSALKAFMQSKGVSYE